MQKSDFEIVIQPNKSVGHFWKDLWSYRELFLFLAWKDIIVRYKQTLIGATWSVIRPFINIVIFTVIFGRIAKLDSGGIPYPLIVAVGAIVWSFFSSSFTDISNALLSNSGILTKVYFPRIIAPISSIVVNMVDMIISFLILFILLIYYHYFPSWNILLTPIFIFWAIIFALGGGLWIGALNIKYRDFKYIVPFMIQIGAYISGVGFTSSNIPEQFRILYWCNPLVGIIDGARWAILGSNTDIYLPGMYVSIAITLILLFIGFFAFRKAEKQFADIV